MTGAGTRLQVLCLQRLPACDVEAGGGRTSREEHIHLEGQPREAHAIERGASISEQIKKDD